METKYERYKRLHPEQVKASQERYRKRHPDRVKAAQAQYRGGNKERVRVARRKWRTKNIERERKRENDYQRRTAPHLKRKFNITLTDYELMLAEQAGACAICGGGPRKVGQARFCVDHDHDTGRVRGLLCVPCNTALGLFEDSTERLIAAVQYLRRH